MKNWLVWTLIFATVGILALPLVFLGLASCCSGGPTLLQSIPAWPVKPIFLLIYEFLPNENGSHIWPLVVAGAIGYGLIPSYFFLLKALWKRLFKPCGQS